MAARAAGGEACSMPVPVRVRVLAVDRSAAASESMCALLDAQPGIDCAGTAASAAEAHALWLAGREPADVVLVDRHLPDEDGLSLCLWLTTRAPAPAVVVHSPNADDALALPALVAGAAALATTPVTGGALAA